jgi:hypothetical protein
MTFQILVNRIAQFFGYPKPLSQPTWEVGIGVRVASGETALVGIMTDRECRRLQRDWKKKVPRGIYAILIEGKDTILTLDLSTISGVLAKRANEVKP